MGGVSYFAEKDPQHPQQGEQMSAGRHCKTQSA